MNIEKEIWKDIPNYEGLYQCSNLGVVKSLKTFRVFKNYITKKGYSVNTLTKNKKEKQFKTHQLVAMTFLNHIPNGHVLVIDHINGIRNDNRMSNLQIVTNRENCTTCFLNHNHDLTSKYVGVHFHTSSNKYRAKLKYKGEEIYLGLYKTELEASNAYQSKLKEILAENP